MPGADPGDSGPDYLRRPLGDFLDRVAAEDPAPGGGAVAAVAIALAAGLAGMAARLSRRHTADAPRMATDADALRRRAAPLARADAEAYGQVLASSARPRQGEDPAARRRRLNAALSHAADVPLAVAEIGSSVAGLAARLAERGNPSLRGDAVTAALQIGR
ncbi:MAG: cyclodeaminase/cyclohydrolase family protein, partial [Actinobacteria bacterium]|nr:cyclodeaminase/cyclohydrolase family protein [Actinomycetota bacterium]